MKIRRILATAVAAAVTAPVVLLSAGPAFAETPKPASSTTVPDAPSREELEEAVARAQAKVDELQRQRDAVEAELKKWDTDPAAIVDPALIEARTAAEEAVEKAEADKAAADEALTAAEERLAAAAPEEKEAAEKAVEEARKAVEDAQGVLDAKEAELETARQNAITGFIEFVKRELNPVVAKLEAAQEELAEAQEALANHEEPKPGDGEEDGEDGEEGEEEGGEEVTECDADTLAVALTGPRSVAAGASAVFSMKVENTSDRKLDDVSASVFAGVVPNSAKDLEELDDDYEQFIRYTTVEWSSDAQPRWTKLRLAEFDDAELGALAEGAEADVKLRLTVAEDAPLGAGVLTVSAQYDNTDGDCGYTEDEDAYFDVVAADSGAEPTPSPSPSSATPAPAAATGNGNTTQQGGSSATPVNSGGQLAATGSGDALPQLAAAAGAAVVLGAGALVVARRRKANA
ncbi:hypothetical protein AB0E83_05720 [Streptomyces sp. NPDC035033]|uniref:hypothetical protein n=1 Tax=Streptomyces sp. NPDC035033 TaxID=3155368 RepID=UPI0033F3C0B6